jgi:S-(hydroxymethyl)glutathione dehydrogenase/alcohol dehydrogenase
MKVKAAVLREIGKPLTIETVDLAAPREDEVLVRVRATGLCHTDLEVIKGQLGFPLPIVLGHEAAGTVVETGSAITHLRPGDPVVLSWNPHCGHCFQCDRGQPILCDHFLSVGPRGGLFDGTTRISSCGNPLHSLMFIGSFAEYCVVPAQCAVIVPAEIPLDRACLIGCGVMTGVGGVTRVAKLEYGASAAIFGCGAVGLSAIQGARIAGAASIIAIDLQDDKLALARRLGASHTINARSQDPVSVIRELTGGRGADHVFEAAGSPQVYRNTMEAVRPGGQVVWLGKIAVDKEVSFRWGSLMGEKRIVRSSYGGARPSRDFPDLAGSYLRGDLKLDEMITQRISLEQINDGFAALENGAAIRSVIVFPD